MNTKDRILSVDIMRGFALLLTLFVTDLYMPEVPEWLVHKAADYDGMGLADWVFPGFLFVVGMLQAQILLRFRNILSKEA